MKSDLLERWKSRGSICGINVVDAKQSVFDLFNFFGDREFSPERDGTFVGIFPMKNRGCSEHSFENFHYF